MTVMAATLPLDTLRRTFGERLREDEPLARYTSSRVGGAADALLEVSTVDELQAIVEQLWELDAPFIILGGGSNVLVSERGVREVVLLNHAKELRFDEEAPNVWAASGANLGGIARQAAAKGLGGLEWAAGIPGTVGGAVYGNAGAHGGDVAGNLELADILHRDKGKESLTAHNLQFTYRGSGLKDQPGEAVVLSATFQLERKAQAAIQDLMDSFLAHRRRTQPPGASMGSMFKNPDGDFAGRLIEAVGLKGERMGHAQISPLHGNFFLNLGEASADDVYTLITQAQAKVAAEQGVQLELEVQLVGEWGAA
jgi:UDP-N-acetylmuramate dehydrogenase